MANFTGLAVCSVTQLDWEGDDGRNYKGILMTPFAGKIPNKRILYTPFLPGMENAKKGDYYLMSFFETKEHKLFGRRFQWTSIDNIQSSDLPPLIKELGPPAILNVENMRQLTIEETKCLIEEKNRYETEIKYFKAIAYRKHKEKELNKSEDDYEIKGYDINDIYIAFDGDIDGMNEFLGNH